MRKVQVLCILSSLYEIAKLIVIIFSNYTVHTVALPYSWYSASPLLILPLFFCLFLFYKPLVYKTYIFPYILTKIMALMSSFFFIYHLTISKSPELMQENFRFLQQFILFLLLFFIIDAILLVCFILVDRKLKGKVKTE